MKINSVYIILLLLILIGCTRKTVQLPVFNVLGIQDTIYDNSQIWIFLETKDGDTLATLNRKNSIATTNWIYNIDKNLPMRLVIPHLQKLIEKREKPSMHPKDEDDFNYFSYVDSGSDLLSMVKFDVIYFEENRSIDHNQFNGDTLTTHLVLDYKPNLLFINDSIVSLTDLNGYFDNLTGEKRTMVHLKINKNITYQNYLALKARLHNINSIRLDTIEYIN